MIERNMTYLQAINPTMKAVQVREALDFALERIKVLEAQLGVTNHVPVQLGLSPHQSTIFGILMANKYASMDKIMTLLYGRTPRDDIPMDNCIKAMVCYMRRKTARFGVKISFVRGYGYLISDEHKAIIKALDGATPN